MKGYPKTVNSKRDYDNLISIPDYASRAKSDLVRESSIDDSIIFLEVGTFDKSSLKAVDNPSPLFKRLGYKDRKSMYSVSMSEEITESK